jgi:hypothetical protein
VNPPPVPVTYLHERCGFVTQVSDHIARDMALDPCYHLSTAVCANCGEVPQSECIMQSGLRLDEHRRAILRAKGTPYHLVRRGLWLVAAFLGALIGLLWGLQAARVGMGFGGPMSALIGAAVGAIIGLLWGHIPRLWMCKLRWI